MSEPIDYWREVVRRGVLAVGYSLHDATGGAILLAELAQPQEGLMLRAAFAAIEMHKLIELEPGTEAHAARAALAGALRMRPAAEELGRYQEKLFDRLWSEVADGPALGLERLAYPHEE